MRLAILVVLVAAVPTLAVAVNFTENFDSYAANGPPGGPWATLPSPFTGSLWVNTSLPRSAPNDYLINNAGFNGADIG